MADTQLSLNFGIESGDAVKGVEQVDEALKKVAEDLPAVEKGAAAAASEFDKLGKEGEDVVKALAGLEKSADSPRGLTRSAAMASLAVEDLRKKLVAAGTPISPALAASLKAVEDKAAAAAKRAGDLKEALDNTRKAGAAASQGAEAMVGSFGSVESVFQQMKASGGEVSKKFADLALQGAGVIAAFSLGYEMGKKLTGVFKEMGVDLEHLADKLIDTKGLLDPLPGKMNEVIKAHQAAARVVQETATELKKLGVEWHSGNEAATKMAATMKLFGTALAESLKRGEGLDRIALANSAALLKLRDALEAEGISLDKIDPKLRGAIQLADGMKKAHEQNAEAAKTLRLAHEELNPAIVAILTSLQKEVEKTGDVATAETKAMAALTAWAKEHGLAVTNIEEVVTAQKALLDATKIAAEDGIDLQKKALEKLGSGLRDAAAATTNFAATYQTAIDQLTRASDRWDRETEAVERNRAAKEAAAEQEQKQFAHMEIIHTELMRATNAQVESLEREIDAFRRLHEEMGSGSDALEDYAATMKAAYESGAMSLVAFNQQMTIAITQLDILIGKNAGTKFAADMMKMVAALRELKDAVNWGTVKPVEKMRI